MGILYIHIMCTIGTVLIIIRIMVVKVWNTRKTFDQSLCLGLPYLMKNPHFDAVALARGASGDGQPSALNLIAAAFCCLLAPMGSAIGVLSGPVATLRGFSLQSPRSLLRTNRRSSVPLLGTVFFLVFACFFKHEDVVSRSMIANGHLIDGLYNVGLAPTFLVLTGYLGISNADASLPRLMIGLGSLLGAIFVIHRIRRESSDRRRWLLIASFLILGGYSLIYCVRVRLVGPETLIGVQRYHLFPCVGLAMLVTTCLADRLRRIDRRPLASVGLAAMVALGLIYLNRPLIRERARFVSLHADQRSVMKVLDRLAVVAHALGVSRAQVLQAFDPIEPRWCYPGGNILKMLPEPRRNLGSSRILRRREPCSCPGFLQRNRLSCSVGNEREVQTHPERLILTHLVLQDSRSGQRRQFRFTPPFGSSWTSSTRESVALAVHLEDLAMMRQAVQKPRGHPLALEDLVPLAERQVARHRQAALVAVGEHPEQKLHAAPTQADVAQFVADQELLAPVGPGIGPGCTALRASNLLTNSAAVKKSTRKPHDTPPDPRPRRCASCPFRGCRQDNNCACVQSIRIATAPGPWAWKAAARR